MSKTKLGVYIYVEYTIIKLNENKNWENVSIQHECRNFQLMYW